MNYILAIETATKNCSVAIFENSRLLDFIEQGGDYSHAELLAPFTEALLDRNNLRVGELSAIAISSGPGSYTGLRIGLAFAKGLCYGNKIPLIAISTLKSMAFGAFQFIKDPDAYYCSMIDARRMEVYTEVYNSKLEVIHGIEAIIIDENSFVYLLKKFTLYFYGDGASKCKSTITHSNANFSYEGEASARFMGSLIFEKYLQEDFEDLAYYKPNYLKEFVALKSKKLV